MPVTALPRRTTRLAADQFARIARADEARLAHLMTGRLRRPLLDLVFWQMPRQLDRAKAAGVDESIEWRITGGPRGADVYRLAIRDGRCRARRGEDEQPATVTIELDGADFMRLVTGSTTGPELYMRGRLRGDGDLSKALRLNQLFRVPQRD